MLELSNVNAGYGKQDIIKNISFTLAKGQSLAIIGPNGCGKTTLLRAIANLIKHSGTITIDGHKIADLKPKQQAGYIAMLGQISAANFAYSVYDTVMMGRYPHQRGFLTPPGHADKKMVENCLNLVNLWEKRDKPINILSGGQLQRVYLARTLAQNPSLILLDEPTNHLDLKHQLQLIDYLRDWGRQEDKGIIGVMHDINLARHLTDNILLMKEGRIAAIGHADDVLKGDLLKDVYEIDVAAAMKKMLTAWVN